MIAVTSLAPKISRLDMTGREVGDGYRTECLSSWRRLADQILTVNPAPEIVDVPGVTPVAVHRDARRETGRSLPYLADLISAGLASGADRVLIINGDVRLAAREPFVDVRPGLAVISKRIDVDSISGDGPGTVHTHGYDAFAVHRADLLRARVGKAVFGSPWSDYHLPISLLGNGVEVRIVHSVTHLRHPLAWSWSLWNQFGWRFARTYRWHFLRSTWPPNAGLLHPRKGPDRVLVRLCDRSVETIDGGPRADPARKASK